VTLIPPLPEQDTRLIPALRYLRPLPGFRFLESLIVTAVAGRDQGYLAQPWVRERSIEVAASVSTRSTSRSTRPQCSGSTRAVVRRRRRSSPDGRVRDEGF
jgi:hypothetical protein